jgi:hypothetical protein
MKSTEPEKSIDMTLILCRLQQLWFFHPLQVLRVPTIKALVSIFTLIE